jgi:hypothetical protein
VTRAAHGAGTLARIPKPDAVTITTAPGEHRLDPGIQRVAIVEASRLAAHGHSDSTSHFSILY